MVRLGAQDSTSPVKSDALEWQDSCAMLGVGHSISTSLFLELHQKRQEWTRTIETEKTAHWNGVPGQGKGRPLLWKAVTHM